MTFISDVRERIAIWENLTGIRRRFQFLPPVREASMTRTKWSERKDISVVIKLELNLEVKKCIYALQSPHVDAQQPVRQCADGPAERPQFYSNASYQIDSPHFHTGCPTTIEPLKTVIKHSYRGVASL